MRQGFIIAAIVLWVAINILGSIGERTTMLGEADPKLDNKTQQDIMDSITQQEIEDSGTTFIGKVGDTIVLLGKIFTLYHPSLWQGDAIYIYYFAILPIGISFWVVIAFMIRGVGSS